MDIFEETTQKPIKNEVKHMVDPEVAQLMREVAELKADLRHKETKSHKVDRIQHGKCPECDVDLIWDVSSGRARKTEDDTDIDLTE